jgi:sulfate transport system permease protein
MKRKKEIKIIPMLLIAASFIFVTIMLIMPLFVIITESLKNGWSFYIASITDEFTIVALILTLQATVIAVVVNTIFGVFAAWTITKYDFKGKKLLTTMIDIPFVVSPVIAGLIFSLTFGRMGWMYEILQKSHIKILFAVPGIILATIFVTFPFISRELIPILSAQGKDEEEAAALMGAGGFTIFRRITFPHMKWALLYGIILCTARAMGEFGAVSVVSGHLRGKTNTLPLQVEILHNEFAFTAAFAVSSILVLMSIAILILRTVVEYRSRKGR